MDGEQHSTRTGWRFNSGKSIRILTIQESLRTNDLVNQDFSITNHPKIYALESKIDMLTVDQKLKANMLLPKIDIGYSYLSERAI
jgi:hypothetical protein